MLCVRRTALVFFFVVLGSAACAAAPALRISLPPVLESLPIAFAEAWGMFDAEGLTVDLIGISDNQERSTALLTGSLDAVLSDVTSAFLDHSAGRGVAVVAGLASTPQSNSMRLALVSHQGFGPSNLEDLLSGNQIVGVTYRTDDEYLLDAFFSTHGAPRAWITRYTYFGDMLQLATWFGAKTLPAAVLPEPYYSYIRVFVPVGGSAPKLVVLSDFTFVDAPPRVLLFRKEALQDRGADVATFLRVVAAAVERLNASSRDEIVGVGLDVVLGLFFQGANRATIQQATIDAISIPSFGPPEALCEKIYTDVGSWMKGKGYLSSVPRFEEFVDARFLP
ncbi:MAG: ABC transporter substrate-binding protein [Candidatus Bipolaricaulota bacterium]